MKTELKPCCVGMEVYDKCGRAEPLRKATIAELAKLRKENEGLKKRPTITIKESAQKWYIESLDKQILELQAEIASYEAEAELGRSVLKQNADEVEKIREGASEANIKKTLCVNEYGEDRFNKCMRHTPNRECSLKNTSKATAIHDHITGKDKKI